MLTAAPLASHLSCWRRSPDERRQLSTWRPMKATDSTRSTIRHPWLTAANQPTGLSRATRPPDVSIRIGCAASAPAVATTEAMSSTAKAAHQTRSAQRQNRDGSLPSGNSRIATMNSARPSDHSSSTASPAAANGSRCPCS